MTLDHTSEAPLSSMSSFTRRAASPTQTTGASFFSCPSPSRVRSGSTRMSSPARSQIFERDVQDTSFSGFNVDAIPRHIRTENYIPSVLDASSEAITDRELDPDAVEIITHNSHQPAMAVAGSLPQSPMAHAADASWADEIVSLSDKGYNDDASYYAFSDSNDVRRLSFISFADVVQGEQLGSPIITPGNRDSFHMAGLTSLTSLNRSASPICSSSGSPPTSKSASIKGGDAPFRALDMSPSRKPVGSPTALTYAMAGGAVPMADVSVETMSEALRRTTSSDVSSAMRSIPSSPV
ncbi:hypothetical protein TD95_004437 [Thielaviopsis punctulata]|uniref:Uncharacterized protein n=1 Tax=Thielaviopsis punctulata TaxID=72032 RepID=A0A0F4ZKI4_9PEZI|nr:hypothetical protein TD95_004437 [Thielaviopsis punctulata]